MDSLLFTSVSSCEHHLSFFNILWSNFDTKGNALHFTLVEFPAWLFIACINVSTCDVGEWYLSTHRHNRAHLLYEGDWHNHHLGWCNFGGITSPLSSPCTMIMAPMILVVKPHEVCWTCCSFPSRFRYIGYQMLQQIRSKEVRSGRLQCFSIMH